MNKLDEKKYSITFFSEDTVVRGNIVSDNVMVLEGEVEGDIASKNKVQIEEGACVNGNISCFQLYCEGIVNGNVRTTDCCELNNKAKIKGELVCASLITGFDCTIEKGLKFKK